MTGRTHVEISLVAMLALFSCFRYAETLLELSDMWQVHFRSIEMFRQSSLTLDTTSIAFSLMVCSFIILANLASILANENSYLFTFAFVQLKFVLRTHRDSATYSLTMSWIMFPWFLATGSGIVVSSTYCHISVFVLLGCFLSCYETVMSWGFMSWKAERATHIKTKWWEANSIRMIYLRLGS